MRVYFSMFRYTHGPMGPFGPIREGMKFTHLHAKFTTLSDWTPVSWYPRTLGSSGRVLAWGAKPAAE